jgi:hypothetical protein
MILSIDPGLHACGLSVWSHDLSNPLLWAGLVKNSGAHRRTMVDSVDAKLYELYGTYRKIDQLAVEVPQVYIASRSKGDPNDLIQLALVVGAFEQWFSGAVFMYKPADWKGQVPKPIMEARILKRLSDDEKNKIEKAPKSLMHNTIDSCGIGLHHLKRL